jgi:peptide/nickel transport system substrate-binding protein
MVRSCTNRPSGQVPDRDTEEEHFVRHRRGFKLLAGVFSLALLAAACGGDDDDDAAEEEEAAETQQGGEIVLGGEQIPSSLNHSHGEHNAFWTALFMERVWPEAVTFQPDGTYEFNEDLNTVELISEDPQTVRYEISEEATWSDGTPITSEDYLFTWEANRGDIGPDGETPIYNSAGTAGYELMDCEADGEKAMECTFSEPYADWYALFAPVLPRHAFEAEGNGDTVAGFNEGYVYPDIGNRLDNVPSGAQWSISEIDGESSMTLVRNEEYWGEPAVLDEVVIRWITDPSTEPAALENQEVDVIFPQAQIDLIQQVEGVPGLEFLVDFGTFFEHVDFNTNNVHLAKIPIRQALGLAMDRQEIVDRLPGQMSPDAEVMNHHFFYPGSAAYQPNGEEMYGAQDIEGAASLIEGEGYALGDDGVYAHPTDGRLSFRFSWRQPNPRREQEFQLLQAQFAEAGIELTPAPVDDFTILDTGDFELVVFGWTSITVPSGHTDIFRTGGGSNSGDYSNTDVDALFEQADAELDPDTRSDILNEIDQILWEELPVIPLFQVPEFLAWNEQVENVEMNGYDSFFFNSYSWGLAV